MVLTYYSMSSIRARRNTVDESQRDKQLENTMLNSVSLRGVQGIERVFLLEDDKVSVLPDG